MASSQQTSKISKGRKFDDEDFKAQSKTDKWSRQKPGHKSFTYAVC